MVFKPRYIRTLTFLLFLFSCSRVFGQGFGGGPSLGVNFSQIDGDNVGGYKKAGLNLGGFVYYSFSKRLALQPEILFSQKGAREVTLASWNVRINYFDVPVLLRYTALNRSFGSLIVEAGPSIGFMVNAKEKYPMIPADVTADYRRYSLEGHAGLSFRLTQGWSLGLRHSLSVLTIHPGTYRLYIINRYISILLRFDLKRK